MRRLLSVLDPLVLLCLAGSLRAQHPEHVLVDELYSMLTPHAQDSQLSAPEVASHSESLVASGGLRKQQRQHNSAY